jgi:S1-C subfamily serine protease
MSGESTAASVERQEWAMSGMSTLAINVLAGLTLTLAPVPQGPRPDPLGRGYMGVWFEGQSLTINRVEPNLPGAKAGLRSGDVIVRVNELQAQSTQQVIDHVCSFRPGATIEMEVQRGNERKIFHVKLGCRPAEPNAKAVPAQPIIID